MRAPQHTYTRSFSRRKNRSRSKIYGVALLIADPTWCKFTTRQNLPIENLRLWIYITWTNNGSVKIYKMWDFLKVLKRLSKISFTFKYHNSNGYESYNERPGTDHVISGPMRGLDKKCIRWRRQTNRQTYGHHNSMTEALEL